MGACRTGAIVQFTTGNNLLTLFNDVVRIPTLSKANTPGKSSKLSANLGGDIPEAIRETHKLPPPPRPRSHQLIWVGITILVSGLGLFGFWWNQQRNLPGEPSGASPAATTVARTQPPQSTAAISPTTSPTSSPETLLGHFPYDEAPASELEPIVADGSILMRKGAAENFRAMAAAAEAAGVRLVPLSGFRSITDQRHLFFEVKAERGQRAVERASVSAPPGYSEHHTGYAIDIGDANTPGTDLSPDFEKTAAFIWLEQNAARYSFELSFPKGNPQGVSYEPWHWRYVGDSKSLETFYKARDIKPSASSGQ